jgi:hypothetical protein
VAAGVGTEGNERVLRHLAQFVPGQEKLGGDFAPVDTVTTRQFGDVGPGDIFVHTPQ